MAKSTKTDVDLKALLVEAMSEGLHGESPRTLIFLFILEPCMNVMFVMGWSLKMRHACDFMVIEQIGSLMTS